MAERVRVAVQSHARDASACAGAAEAIAFTVSIGVAASPADSLADYEALMHVADQRPYMAKEGGRNRVVDADAQAPDVLA